jgi:hypothetical protein
MTSPFGPLVLIANPRAGRGKVGGALPKIERILTEAGLSYRIVQTTHAGHATQAARDALHGGERYLVATGGDGTVHEVVNGMIADDQPIAADAVLGRSTAAPTFPTATSWNCAPAGYGWRPIRRSRSRRTGKRWARHRPPSRYSAHRSG